jgi:hypothetical protein
VCDQNGRVAGSLCGDQLTEGERATRDFEIDFARTEDLQNTPSAGPPLWYWPVECRNRGPHPKVVGRPLSAATSSKSRELRHGGAIDVGLDRDVSACAEASPERVENARQGAGGGQSGIRHAHLDVALDERRSSGLGARVEEPG